MQYFWQGGILTIGLSLGFPPLERRSELKPLASQKAGSYMCAPVGSSSRIRAFYVHVYVGTSLRRLGVVVVVGV